MVLFIIYVINKRIQLIINYHNESNVKIEHHKSCMVMFVRCLQVDKDTNLLPLKSQ
jgi:hypothetical protein